VRAQHAYYATLCTSYVHIAAAYVHGLSIAHARKAMCDPALGATRIQSPSRHTGLVSQIQFVVIMS
jgi:hypothetical protein